MSLLDKWSRRVLESGRRGSRNLSRLHIGRGVEVLEPRRMLAADITIAIGGTASLDDLDELDDFPGINLVIDPDTINHATQLVTLRAQGNIFVEDPIAILGQGVALELQAGGSIRMAADISTADGPISLIALGGTLELGRISAGGSATITLTAAEDVLLDSVATGGEVVIECGGAIEQTGPANQPAPIVENVPHGPHPGDANLDGVTDVRDFMLWNAHKFTDGTEWATGDFNGDGGTDVRDFMIWNAHKFTSQAVIVGTPTDPEADVSASKVTLRSGAGIGGPDGLDVATGDLTAEAAGPITLNTNAEPVSQEITLIVFDIVTLGVGDVVINEAGHVDLDNVVTFDGAIHVTADSMTATNVNSSNTDDDTNDITLIVTGNDMFGVMELGTITAGTQNDVHLDSGVPVTNLPGKITADELTANTAFGMQLDTTVNSIVARPGMDTEIVITETDEVTVDIDTMDTDISITAGGTVTATRVVSLPMMDGGDIAITTTSGDILVGVIDTAMDGDLTLDSAGSIVSPTSQITVGRMTTSASGPIDLAVNHALDLTASTSAPGDITIDAAFLARLTAVTTFDGAVAITSGYLESVVHVNTSATDNDANDVTVTATNPVPTVEIGAINAGTLGDATLDIAGPITDGPGKIAADELTATAGGPMTLETEVTSITASTTGPGDIVITETGHVTLTDVATLNGSISVTADGITAVSVDSSNTDDDTNDISLIVTGNDVAGVMELGTITAGTQNDVQIFSGVPITNLPGKITADALTISSAAGARLDTTVNSIDAMGGMEDYVITETDELIVEIDDMEGDISITAGGTVTATRLFLPMNDDGDISITTTSGDILVGLIEAMPGGRLTLDSAGAIGGSASDINVALITARAAGPISLNVNHSDSISAVTSAPGDITLTTRFGSTLANIVTFDGAVTVTSDFLGRVTMVDTSATDNDANDVTITVTDPGTSVGVGAINAGTLGDVTLNVAGPITDWMGKITADELTVNAGGPMTLETEVTSIIASTTASGDIVITETGHVTLTDIATLDGSITVTADGMTAISVDSSNTDDDTNDISLIVTGNDVAGVMELGNITAGMQNDVSLNSGVAITDLPGKITADELTAGGALEVRLDTTVNSIDVQMALEECVVTETDEVTVNIGAMESDISITAGGTVTANRVISDPAVGREISITTTSGDILTGLIETPVDGHLILDSAGSIDRLSSRISVDRVTARAAGPITLNMDLVPELAATTSAPGDITINAALLAHVTEITTFDGAVAISAGFLESIVNIDTSATDNDANDVTISVTDPSAVVNIGTINAGTQGDVTLDMAGPITDGPGKIAADELTATAGGPMTLETEVTSVIASTTASGDIVITETGHVTLTDVVTSDGSITVTADGMTAINVDSSNTDDNTNDISLIVTGNDVAGVMELGNITAGMQNDVSLNSGVAITDLPGKITADELTAGGALEVRLDTTVNSIDVQMALEECVVTETDEVTVNIGAMESDISITAGGTVTANRVISDPAVGREISITTTSGDILTGLIETPVDGHLILDSAGSIDRLSSRISVDRVTARAAGPITLIMDLVLELAATTSAPGDITINAALLAHVTEITTFDGAVAITSGFLESIVKIDTSSTDSDSNDVTISVADPSAVVNIGTINAGTLGDVTLDMAGPITDGPGKITADELTATAAGPITLETEVTSIIASTTAPGDIVITETDDVKLQLVETMAGSIHATADGSINVSKVNSQSTGDVTIAATQGNVTLPDGSSIVAAGGHVELGTADILQLDAQAIVSASEWVKLNIGTDNNGGLANLLGTVRAKTPENPGDRFLQVLGGMGDDRLTLQLQTVKLPNGELDFKAGDGDDTFAIDATSDRDVFEIDDVAGEIAWRGASLAGYVSVETLELNTQAGDDQVLLQMSPTGTPRLKLDGGDDSGAFDAPRDALRINGSSAADVVTVGPFSMAVDSAPFQIQGVETLQVFGNGGNDQITNGSHIAGMLDGGAGNDRLTGSNATGPLNPSAPSGMQIGDAIFGGAGADLLEGGAGDDFLFADHAYHPSNPPVFQQDGDKVVGGSGNDTIIALGRDEVSAGGSSGDLIIGEGLRISVIDWLMARFVKPEADTISDVFDNRVMLLPWMLPIS